jgi:hypothetical protein
VCRNACCCYRPTNLSCKQSAIGPPHYTTPHTHNKQTNNYPPKHFSILSPNERRAGTDSGRSWTNEMSLKLLVPRPPRRAVPEPEGSVKRPDLYCFSDSWDRATPPETGHIHACREVSFVLSVEKSEGEDGVAAHPHLSCVTDLICPLLGVDAAMMAPFSSNFSTHSITVIVVFLHLFHPTVQYTFHLHKTVDANTIEEPSSFF